MATTHGWLDNLQTRKQSRAPRRLGVVAMGFSISGLARSGKDTLADILLDFGYRKDHFAADLKRIATTHMGWDGLKDERGRVLLQQLGTEVGRAYHNSMWLIKFARRNGLTLPGGDVLPGELSDVPVLRRRAMELGCEDSYVDVSSRHAMLLAFSEFGWNGLFEAAGANLIGNLEGLAGSYDAKKWATSIPSLDEVFTGLSSERRAHEASTSKAAGADWLLVPDTRFPNELGLCEVNGMVSVKVTRPGVTQMQHASETALDGARFGVVVHNTGTLEDLTQMARVLESSFRDGSLKERISKEGTVVISPKV